MVIAQAMELEQEEEVGPLNHRQLSLASTHHVHWQTLTIYQSRLFVTTLITPFTIHFGTRAICPPRLSNLGPLASIPLTTSNDPPKVIISFNKLRTSFLPVLHFYCLLNKLYQVLVLLLGKFHCVFHNY